MQALLSRGFAIESGVLWLGAAVGAALGWSTAEALLSWLAESLGVGALFFSSPSELLLVRLKPSVALALPCLAAWVAILLHRGRSGGAPSTMGFVIYVGLPWVAAIGAELARLQWIRAALELGGEGGAPGGPEVLISALEILPGSWAMRSSALVGPALWILALASGGRPPPAPSAEVARD